MFISLCLVREKQPKKLTTPCEKQPEKVTTCETVESTFNQQHLQSTSLESTSSSSSSKRPKLRKEVHGGPNCLILREPVQNTSPAIIPGS